MSQQENISLVKFQVLFEDEKQVKEEEKELMKKVFVRPDEGELLVSRRILNCLATQEGKQQREYISYSVHLYRKNLFIGY